MSSAVALLLLLVPLAGHGNDVVVQHVDGSSRLSLTGGAGYVQAGARWSPDGTKVAFASNPDSSGQGATHIYVVNADASNLRELTPGASGTGPAWSGDGTQIAFLSGTGAAIDVWTVPAAGGAPRRLTTSGGAKRGLSWSPDSSTILYGGEDSAGPALFALDPTTGGVRRLASIGPFNGPAGTWSPDGLKIAYSTAGNQLAVMSADGSGSRALDDQSLTSPPSWSPDGRAIGYAATRVVPGPSSRFSGPPTDSDIWTTDVETGRSRRLTGAFDANAVVAPSSSPTWWPDGSRILYQSYRSAGTVGWQMNADGSCEQPVAAVTGFHPEQTPLWQPSAVLVAGPLSCADLRLRIIPGSTQVALGASASASVVIENDGNLPANDVHAHITSLDGQMVSLTACGAADCSFGTISPGSSRAFEAAFGGVHHPTNVRVTISASSAEPDPTPENAIGSVSAQVLNCTIVGTWAADVLYGTVGADRICGLPGSDRIEGGKGNDYIDAGNGNDTVVGGPGRDTIIARGGGDVIYARDGQLDWIDCGTEYDIAVVDRLDHVHHCEKVVRG